MEQSHQILGVPATASVVQIRNAYRKLAKQFHPDLCKEPDAERRFIEITEAYEALIGKSTSTPPVENPSTDLSYVKEEKRRARANEYARMQYNEFKKNNDAFKRSWYYWPTKVFLYSIVIGGYGIAAGMFLSPVIAYYIDDFSGVAAFILFLFSSLFGRSIWELHRGISPYFTNYD